MGLAEVLYSQSPKMKSPAKGTNSSPDFLEIQKLTTEQYTNKPNRQNAKFPKDPTEKFYARLHNTLKALERIQSQLPPAIWRRFIPAYSQHWLHAIDHGEKATPPGAYYNEWAEAQTLGVIGVAGNDDLHAARSYHVYESPRERARQVLGLEEGAGV